MISDDDYDLPSLGKDVGEWVCITRARHDAEQAVVEAAKESRAAEKEATKLGRQTGYGTPRAVHASRALDRAVDALSTSQRDRQEATPLPGSIEDAIDAWHNIPTNVQLHEFLGMTQAQYARWVETRELPDGSPFNKRGRREGSDGA